MHRTPCRAPVIFDVGALLFQQGISLMKKKIALFIATVLILLTGAYFGIGYVLYDKLSAVPPDYNENTANTPANFQVRKTKSFPTPFAGFDTTPYLMPQYEVVRF